MMRFIQKSGQGWDVTGYEAYVESVRNLRPDLWELMKPERNQLQSPDSMHDSLMRRFSQVAWDDSDRMSMDLRVEFEGPYADREFHIQYNCAFKFSLEKIGKLVMPLEIMLQELEIEEGGLIHRMAFTDGSVWEIHCENINFEEVMRS